MVSEEPRTGGRWRSPIGVAAGVTAAVAWVLTLASGGGLRKFAGMALVSACFAAAYVVIVRPRAGTVGGPGWRRVVGELLVLVGGAVLATGAAWVLLGFAGGSGEPLRVGLMGLGVMTAVRLVETGYDRLRRHIREVELRNEELRRRSLEAELAALRARTDPHFLFNALNTVAGLIEEDPQRAVAVVSRLAGYFRHAHAAAASGAVTLRAELEAATAWLEIQQLRFGDRLRWRVRVEPGLERIRSIPFLLQPLVDNAVRYGLEAGRAVTVTVEARRTGNLVEVAVEDDGPGPGGSVGRGTGTALTDLARRLELRWGRRAGMVVGAGGRGGFRVAVTFPAEEAA